MKRLEYTKDGFRDYLLGLRKGDFVIVMKDGHEFVKLAVSSIDSKNGWIRADHDKFSMNDGFSVKTKSRIMCPSQNVIGQWETCILRGRLADRASTAFSHKKCMSLPIEDLRELLTSIGVSEDWLKNIDREFRETGKLKQELSDIACKMWRYNVVVRLPIDDLEYLIDLLEGRLVE